ncbi:MAG: hypothetical protein GTO45_32910, partial [Candidatus Aminicenantes bacterium]|nr:hypothetical protein [Candidatus Aminicenantes bacterium]NIN22941.1 hypothetical protein [Candidatus Aminicenantes bacterium]NIN46678.1 hypothetical protein [Candidatus Aminicenantes bacterium]NIN89584.1 hypothetical protein [Candidatus Aminicenantes bacterium]NIO86132.1 hypothetical protein [Candidatus Aminicenantes bacterium]
MNATTYRVPRKKVLKTTVRLIKEIAWTNRNKPEIKYAAVKILEDSGIQNGRDRRRVAVALSDFIKNEIKYFYDPHRGETIQTPQITLAVRYGDCDDMAVLLAALLMSCGIEARFHVKGYNRPQHIYVEALTQDGWIGLDPARTAGDPHPSQLKTFMLSGYREVKKKMRGIGNYETGGIGQVPRMNNKLRAKRIKGEIRTRRPLTPVTKAGTLIEQAANAPVIVRVSRPRKPGQTPDVRVSVLPHISPHRIEKYEVDRNRGLLYPVLKKEPELKDSPTYLDMGITETDTLNRALASPDIIKDLGLSGVEEFNEL